MAINIRVQIDSQKSYLVPLTEGTTIIFGRSRKADLQLNDPKISGLHLKVCYKEKYKITASDLGSTNHSFKNGSMFEGSHIYVNDIITIGHVNLSIDRDTLTSEELQALLKDDLTQVKRTKVTHLKVVEEIKGATDLKFAQEEPDQTFKEDIDSDFDMRSPSGGTKFIKLDTKQLKQDENKNLSSRNLKVKRMKKNAAKKKGGLLARLFNFGDD